MSVSTKCDLNKTWTILPEDEDPGDDGGGKEKDEILNDRMGDNYRKSSTTSGLEDDDDEDENANGAHSLLNLMKSLQRDKRPNDLLIFNSQFENFESLFDENFRQIIEFE